jgi:hypothetical protein
MVACYDGSEFGGLGAASPPVPLPLFRFKVARGPQQVVALDLHLVDHHLKAGELDRCRT